MFWGGGFYYYSVMARPKDQERWLPLKNRPCYTHRSQKERACHFAGGPMEKHERQLRGRVNRQKWEQEL